VGCIDHDRQVPYVRQEVGGVIVTTRKLPRYSRMTAASHVTTRISRLRDAHNSQSRLVRLHDSAVLSEPAPIDVVYRMSIHSTRPLARHPVKIGFSSSAASGEDEAIYGGIATPSLSDSANRLSKHRPLIAPAVCCWAHIFSRSQRIRIRIDASGRTGRPRSNSAPAFIRNTGRNN